MADSDRVGRACGTKQPTAHCVITRGRTPLPQLANSVGLGTACLLGNADDLHASLHCITSVLSREPQPDSQ